MHDASLKSWPERFLTVPESKWFMFWLKHGRIVFIILKTCGGAPRQRACEFCNNILYTFAIYVLYKHTFQRCTEVGQVRGKYCRELGTCANSCDNAMMFYEKKWLHIWPQLALLKAGPFHSIRLVCCYPKNRAKFNVFTLIKLLWEKTHVRDVVSSNPSAGYWMNLFRILILLNCIDVWWDRKYSKKRPGMAH